MRPSGKLVSVTLMQVACSLTVVSLSSSSLLGPSDRCYLSSDPTNTGPCTFAIAAGAVSLATAVLGSCLQCVSCDCCGLGPVGSTLLAAFNSVWWLVAAAILTAEAATADASGLRRAGPRHALVAAAWIAAVVELIHSILACVVVGNNVCNILCCIPVTETDEECCEDCCGGCCCEPRGRRHHAHHRHHAEPLLSGPAAAAAAAVATSAALSRRTWWGMAHQQQQQQQQQQRPGAAWPHAAGGGQGGVPAPGGAPGSCMPPPPTAGQPYVYSAPQQPPMSAVGVAAGQQPPMLQPAAFHQGMAGFSAVPTAGFSGHTAPSAPYAPPVILQQQQQQQQQQQRPLQQSDARLPPPAPRTDMYPQISKQ